MKQKLLDELMKVSEEEQKYLDGQGNIERQLYVNEKLEEIDRERFPGTQTQLCRDYVCGPGQYYALYRRKRISTS